MALAQVFVSHLFFWGMRFPPTFPFASTPWRALCLKKRRSCDFATSPEKRWILRWRSLSQRQVLWLVTKRYLSQKRRPYLPSPRRALELRLLQFLSLRLPRRVTLLPRRNLRRFRLPLLPPEDVPEDRRFAALLRRCGTLLLLEESAPRNGRRGVLPLPPLPPAPGGEGASGRLRRRRRTL